MSKKKNKNNSVPEISLAIPQIPKLLGEIIVKPQAELKKFCREYLKYKGYTVSNKVGFLYAAGNIPVMLVAHLDTVHTENVREFYISNMGNITSPQGIGGDDRCGVYAILDLISRTDYRPYILFAEDEEIGCIGSGKFAEKVDKYKPNVNFIIEIDRKGSNDAVYYDCDNPEFEEFISSYGFETEWGSYSDIAEIAPAMGVAAVNLSSGYYKAHTTDEYISMIDLNNTIGRIEQIIADVADGKTKKYEYIEAVYASKYYGKGLYDGWYNDYDYDYIKEAEAIHLAAGQKFSRVLNRLFKYCGLDQMSEYNRLYAKISDSINPLKATKISVLSVNFLDYLLMSNGNSWSTCQTIVDHNNCSGVYKAGALSYANDKLTMVYYTINKDYEGTDYCLEPKITRQLFFYKDNLLVQERLYPKTHDCDDNSSEISLVAQYRNLVEDIIATCEGKPNFWEKAEVSICATSDSFMYRDWDCFTNWKYKIKGEEIPKRITVGSTSYCLRCGEARDYDCGREDEEECRDLYCEECHYYVRCAGCGKEFKLSTGWNCNYTIINCKYYSLDCGCVTYCNFHGRYELVSENEFTEVKPYGMICKEAFDELVDRRLLFKCSFCGKYSMIMRGGDSLIRFCDSKPVCGDCVDELIDGYTFDVNEMTYITYAS